MTVPSRNGYLKKAARQQPVKKVVGFTLLLLIILWIGSVGILTGLLINRLVRLRHMASDPAHLNLTAVADEVHGVRQEFSILHGELAPLLWVSSRFGGDVGAAEPLMDAGAESLVAADEALNALAPSLGTFELSTLSMKQMPQILDALAAARPTLANAQTHIDTAAAALARINGPLSPRVDGWVSTANKGMQLAQIGIRASQILPGLLAQAGSRTYLVILQNSYELRPTGGFMTAVGRVEISHGQLGSMTFQDSYAIDDFTKMYPDPPRPLQDYMGSEQWVFRDANWSPDFPTTALEAIRLYQISRPEQVDGVIGLTVDGAGMLIAGLGPLVVPDLPEPVTSANFSKILQEMWNPPPGMNNWAEMQAWFSTRKQGIGMIMSAAIDKLLTGKANWTLLGQGTLDAFNQRQLMLYTIPEADELKQLRWDGAVRSSQDDFLMVVDANVGFNKVNPLVTESVDYQVALQPDGAGHAVLELNYIHHGKRTDILCKQPPPLDNITYDKLMQTCYYDYLRLILPSGSQLLAATPHPVQGEYLLSHKAVDGQAQMLQNDLQGRSVIGQFFVVEYGKQLLAHFEYALPVVVADVGGQEHYRLLLQKQAGTSGTPVKVTLTLPAQARLLSSNPTSTLLSGRKLEFDLHLDVDRQIEVVYTLAP